MHYRDKLVERLLTNISIHSSGCWNWTAYTDPKGYGRLEMKRMECRAHRISYMLFNGDIPKGLSVRHTCDNRRCVNPDHLLIGTNADNNRDRDLRGRTARGKAIPKAKLTWSQVKRIRSLKGPNINELAKKYGVSPTCISNIIMYKRRISA